MQNTVSVFAAILGRPNVGKSSLLNRLVGEKVAIVTSKPQTTRTRITGVLTKEHIQFVFLDTPGIHVPKTKLGQRMAKAAKDSVADVDMALVLFEPYGDLNEVEVALINELAAKKMPAIAVVNKTDTLKKESDLDARIQQLAAYGTFEKIVGISAREDKGCEELLSLIAAYGSEGPHYFPADAYTDMPEKVLVAELLREKMLLNLYDELPHGTAVTVESFKEREDGSIIDIDVNIYCEKKSHKGMIIGKGGEMLKKIASAARVDCEEFLGTKVNLQCWVKIKDDWRDNDFLLNNFGFTK